MKYLRNVDPQIYAAVVSELKRQQDNLELIASENFTSLAVLEAQGSVFTNKYAEGYPNARWYGGCTNVDEVEILAIERAKKLFKAEHVNVQAHSGTQANMAVYFSALKFGDKVLAMDLACGGHLTHGHPHNFSGMFYNVITYGVDKKTELLDYDKIMDLAKRHKPKMILAGASAYPRRIDFKHFRKICDKVGAYLFVDMAHIAGLVEQGCIPRQFRMRNLSVPLRIKLYEGPAADLSSVEKSLPKKLMRVSFPVSRAAL